MEIYPNKCDKLPWEWQEVHSPTEIVELNYDNSRVPVLCRRRIQDARIWNCIEDNHYEREALRIIRGFHYICWGGMCRARSLIDSCERSGFEGELGYEGFMDYLRRCKDDYLSWAEACKKDRVCHRAIVDLLYFAQSAKEVEKNYRKRHGWALRNLIKGLGLYY